MELNTEILVKTLGAKEFEIVVLKGQIIEKDTEIRDLQEALTKQKGIKGD